MYYKVRFCNCCLHLLKFDKTAAAFQLHAFIPSASAFDVQYNPKIMLLSWLGSDLLVSSGLCQIKVFEEVIQNFQIRSFTFSCFLDK